MKTIGIALLLTLLACAPGDLSRSPRVESAEAAAPRQESKPSTGPFLRVLGTVQDGGLPHAACDCARCERARAEPTAKRHVASLAIVLPESGKTFLIDATPDLREQLVALRDVRGGPRGRVDREPLDGVLLTHAHMGHYLGLAFFGFEVIHTRELPVFCTPRMASFLRENGPWKQLHELQNLRIIEVEPGGEFDLGEGVRVQALAVPHRDEYSDTVAFVIRGPRSSVLYVPDTDGWSHWRRPLPELLSDIDVALLDGTFYSLDELPGRSVASVGHPLIVDSMDLLEERVAAGGIQVFFTHMNHSNPALLAESDERREIKSRGFALLEEGWEHSL